MITNCFFAIACIHLKPNSVMNLYEAYGFTANAYSNLTPSDEIEPTLSMRASHPAEDVRIRVALNELRNRSISDIIEQIVSWSQTNTYRNQPLESGLPIGAGSDRSHYYSQFSGSSARVIAGTEGWCVTGDVFYAGRKEGGKIAWGRGSKVQHRTVLEMAMRLALAEAVAGNFSDGKRFARIAPLAAATPLSTWLARRNLPGKLRPNIAHSFTHRGKQIIIPLASNKMKVGDRWIPFSGLVGYQDGEWLLPSDAIRILDSL